jgi:hypothetical protein
MAFLFRPPDFKGQTLFKLPAVKQSGQLVAGRQSREAFLGFLQFLAVAAEWSILA